MAKHVLKNIKLLVDQYAMDQECNNLSLEPASDVVEISTLGNEWRDFIPGPLKGDLRFQGFLDYNHDGSSPGELESYLHTLAKGGAAVVSLCPEPDAAVADRAFNFNVIGSGINMFGQYGSAAPFSMNLSTNGVIGRGVVEANGAVTVTGATPGSVLGAVTASEQLIATLHVTAITGTTVTLDGDIESSATGAWAGEETTRGSFTQVTDGGGVTSELVAINGAITDTYWRINWTVSGTASFTVFAVLGIATKS